MTREEIKHQTVLLQRHHRVFLLSTHETKISWPLKIAERLAFFKNSLENRPTSSLSCILQETLLPQTNRAMRCRNLINCCTTGGTRCKTNPQKVKFMELDSYG